MNGQQIFILIAILSLLIIFGFVVFFRSKHRQIKPLTPLTGLAFAFIAAGISFGEERWLGYGLMGLGVILSVLDAFLKLRKNK